MNERVSVCNWSFQVGAHFNFRDHLPFVCKTKIDYSVKYGSVVDVIKLFLEEI